MSLTIAPVMPAKKPPKSVFGQRLFALRKARGLTQIQLAEATGTTQRVISYYETEADLPPASALITLAKVLHVSTDELLGLKPVKVESDQGPEKRRLWKRFQKMASLPARDQRAVIRLIHSLTTTHSAEART